jgi:mannosyltransferase OCH1-like enzyme
MFDEWSLKMPDLEVMAYGDAQLDEWVAKRFGGTGLQDIWNRLPRAVLKSDVFRYLVLLLDGGIYADSDSELAIHFCKS